MELLERVLENNNLYQAIAKVVSNKGSGGVDGMNVEDGSKYFMKNIETIKENYTKKILSNEKTTDCGSAACLPPAPRRSTAHRGAAGERMEIHPR